MKTVKPYLPLFLLAFAGCRNSLMIERNESILLNSPAHQKVICIDPRFYFDDDKKNYQLEKLGVLTKNLRKDILKFSKKNNLELTLFDLYDNPTAGYYDELLQLKQNMLAVNFNQSTPLNFNSRKYKDNTIQKTVFVYPPRISYDFNSLSAKYGTAYFSYLGIYIVSEHIVLYHIVVDTDRSETIYREYKRVSGGPNDGKIAQMIYDSYATLGKELKRK